jgi:Protein of unknown function (DUF2764).
MLFKNQYYYFISGLPDFLFDSMKLPFTVEEFKAMLDEVLKPDDKKLLSRYFLKYDNDNLFNMLKNKDAVLHLTGKLSREEIVAMVEKVKADHPIKNKEIPPYYEEFIKVWLSDEVHDESRLWEDLLTSLYMDYGMEVKNSLISKWFELNLNIGNILSAIYARKYGMDVAKVIVGNNTLAKIIRENAGMRDFGISQELEYFDALQRISEEPDIYERERKIDKFRWDWLEENSVFDYFTIEYIFAYLCKLQILERWVNLNAKEGERVFRELISNLKNEIQMPEDI